MRVRYLTMGFACISYLALGLAPTQVSAQIFRGSPLPATGSQSSTGPVRRNRFQPQPLRKCLLLPILPRR